MSSTDKSVKISILEDDVRDLTRANKVQSESIKKLFNRLNQKDENLLRLVEDLENGCSKEELVQKIQHILSI